MIIAILILFILFIITAEYYSISRNSNKEHWANYKPIVNKGRLSQNQARVIPMFNMALNPVQPNNKTFSWTQFFDGSKFRQLPINISFYNLTSVNS